MFNDEIIHLLGGPNEYIGKLDQSPHPLGENWYRINNPCLVFYREDARNKRLNTVVASLSADGVYRKFIDVRIPPECPMEIRVLDKKGSLYEIYSKESERTKPSVIHVPNFGIATG